MGLTLLSQPAQAIVWNFSYSANNGGSGDTSSFTGTLTSDGTSPTANTIYNVSSAAGTLTFNGDDFAIAQASGTFQWDGTTGILLDFFPGGILFDNPTVLGEIFCDSSNCQFGAYESANLVQQINAPRPNLEFTASSLTPTAVPLESDALPIIGSAIFMAGGVWAKRKFAKPLTKV